MSRRFKGPPLHLAYARIRGVGTIHIRTYKRANSSIIASRVFTYLADRYPDLLLSTDPDEVEDLIEVVIRAGNSFKLFTNEVRRQFADDLRKYQQRTERRLGQVSTTSELEEEHAASSRFDAAPAGHPFDAVIGPFYDSAGVALRLRVTSNVVRERTRSHQLLGCETAEGTFVYPTFQFGGDNALLPGLETVLTTMSEGTGDNWQVALWLRAPSKQLQDQSPVQALTQGKVEAVERLAKQTAMRWQQ